MKKAIVVLCIILIFTISACGSNAAPTAIPTVVLTGGSNDAPKPASSNGDVVASGFVVPAREAHLAFVGGGNVRAVKVTVGQQVNAGDVLAELDTTLAQLEVERAERALRELTSPAAVAAAEEAVASAQKDLKDAQNKADGALYPRASDTLIDNVEGEITLAEKRLTLATKTYNHFRNLPDGDSQKAAALVAMTKAQLDLNALRAKFNWYTGKPSETDIAIVKAKLGIARAVFQEAQWYLSALKGEQVPLEATGLKLAQLQQAKSDLESARARLDQSRLLAPIAGVAAEVNIIAGEYATPGKVLIVIVDDQLQIRTTDLSERDIPRVKVGDPAFIVVKALSGESKGRVLSISPLANTLGGDVVYEVTLSFDEQPAGALAGMTAEVTIGE